jgi:two-component system response regulator PilR (NtrC family)
VIVADDDDDMRSAVAEALRIEGYLVSEAHDGAELIAMLDDGSVRPDIIVADIKMPRLSGFGVLQALTVGHRDVPVVLITALSDGPVGAVALKLGAVGVLHKPFDSDDLLTAVCNARHVVDARQASHGG